MAIRRSLAAGRGPVGEWAEELAEHVVVGTITLVLAAVVVRAQRGPLGRVMSIPFARGDPAARRARRPP